MIKDTKKESTPVEFSSIVVNKAKNELYTTYKRTTYLFAFTTAILALAFLFLLPLKKDVPYILKVDKYLNAGELTMLDSPKEFSEDESVRLASVGNFITNYENYNIFSVETQLKNIKTSSTGAIYKDFENAIYKGSNNLLETLGADTEIQTDISSIVELDPIYNLKDYENDTVYNYDVKIVKNYIKDGSVVNKVSYRILINFIFVDDLTLSIKERINNPLNMIVISYKKTEYSNG